MLSSGLPPILLVLSVLDLSWSLSDEEKKIILDEHNKYRSQVIPPAKAMMKMTWDTDLEVTAQADAEKCIWAQDRKDRQGKTVAAASTLDVRLAVEEWNRERKFYSLTTGKCDPGQMCDDYTQMVWAGATHIGCRAHFCEKIHGTDKENMHLLVCSYFPPGNINGRKPYMHGPSCRGCPKDTVCVNNLCEKQQRKTNGKSVDPPKSGAPSTCLGLLLFLLPTATLVGLLL